MTGKLGRAWVVVHHWFMVLLGNLDWEWVVVQERGGGFSVLIPKSRVSLKSHV